MPVTRKNFEKFNLKDRKISIIYSYERKVSITLPDYFINEIGIVEQIKSTIL